MVFARGAAFVRGKGPQGVTQDLQPKVVNKDFYADDGAGFRVEVARLVSREARAKVDTPGTGVPHQQQQLAAAAAAGRQQQGMHCPTALGDGQLRPDVTVERAPHLACCCSGAPDAARSVQCAAAYL